MSANPIPAARRHSDVCVPGDQIPQETEIGMYIAEKRDSDSSSASTSAKCWNVAESRRLVTSPTSPNWKLPLLNCLQLYTNYAPVC
jgi:hypothetical protein